MHLSVFYHASQGSPPKLPFLMRLWISPRVHIQECSLLPCFAWVFHPHSLWDKLLSTLFFVMVSSPARMHVKNGETAFGTKCARTKRLKNEKWSKQPGDWWFCHVLSTGYFLLCCSGSRAKCISLLAGDTSSLPRTVAFCAQVEVSRLGLHRITCASPGAREQGRVT